MGDEGKEVSEGAKSEVNFQKSQMEILLAAINGIKSQVATLEHESKTQKESMTKLQEKLTGEKSSEDRSES